MRVVIHRQECVYCVAMKQVFCPILPEPLKQECINVIDLLAGQGTKVQSLEIPSTEQKDVLSEFLRKLPSDLFEKGKESVKDFLEALPKVSKQ